MAAFKVVSNLKHNGRNYRAGEVAEFDEEVAEQLLEQGVLTIATKEVVIEEEVRTGGEKITKPKTAKPVEKEETKEEGTGGEEENKKPDYSKMKKPELTKLAEEAGITVPKKATNADIIKLIEENESSDPSDNL